MSRSITSNTLINLAGQSIPIAFALFAIPTIIHDLGTDRFGILALAWLVIGYFSLFDLGLGRALTQLVADRKANHSPDQLATTVWTAMIMMLVMGLLGGMLIGWGAPVLAHSVLKVPAELQQETATTLLILAAGIPIVVVSAGLVGLLTAYDRFDLINAVRLPLGISNFAGPLLILPFSHSLVDITIILVICRAMAAMVQLLMCRAIMPALRTRMSVNAADIGPLVRVGGWMTVTNIISPLMVNFDRFLIGALVSVTAVAYYATPYEIATKMLILPGAIAATLFPRFAALHKIDSCTTLDLLISGWEAVLLLLFPIVLLVTIFAKDGLNLWLGAEFAIHSSPVLQWLSIGILFNALAHIPFALVQGAGRADLSAKAHIVEVVIYLPLLWWALDAVGIVGAAIVWAIRTLLDAALLCLISGRLVPGFTNYLRRTAPLLILTFVCLVIITLLPERNLRLFSGLGAVLCAGLLLRKLTIASKLGRIIRERLQRIPSVL